MLSSGESLDRYVIEAVLGEGGMATVYLAYDPRLRRRLAVKVVRLEGGAGDGAAGARLVREALAVAALAHPNIVAVYDVGETEHGAFIAMELVRGKTLRAYVGDAAVTPPEKVRWLTDVARALSAAHAQGIVHRDVKPGNVMVSDDGTVKVLDFGVARWIAAPAPSARPEGASAAAPVGGRAEATTMTLDGAVVGTPRYMSPEQLRGEAVDGRTDQFAWGLLAYELLTGRHPWPAVDDPIAMWGEMALNRPAPLGPALPQDLAHVADVVARALMPSPAERFGSVDDLVAALEEPAAPDVAVKQATSRSFRRRRLRLRSLAGPAAFAIVAVAALAASATARFRTHDDVARTALSTSAAATAQPPALAPARAGSARAAAVVLRVDDRSGVDEVRGAAEAALAATLQRSVRLDAYANRDLDAVAAELGVRPDDANLAGTLAARDGIAVLVVETKVEAADHGFTVSALLRRVPPGAADVRAEEEVESASVIPGAFVRIGRALRTALGDPESEVDEPDDLSTAPLTAVHEWALGDALSIDGDASGAVTHFQRAVAAYPAFTEAHAALGIAFYNLTRMPESAAELEIALASGDRIGERRRLRLLGDYDDTVSRYLDAVAAYQQLLSRWPGDAAAERSLTATAIDAGEWPLAVETARRAAADRPREVMGRGNLVLALLGSGAYADARREGDAMLRELPEVSRSGFAFAGIAQVLDGDRDAALATYGRLSALDPEYADENRADLAIYEGRLDDGEALLRTWIDDAVARGDPSRARTEYAALAALALRRGRAGEALAAAIAAAQGSDTGCSVELRYEIARLLVAAGATARALDLTRSFSTSPSPAMRAYRELVEGDVALARGDPKRAIALDADALRVQSSWIGHERLGAAYLASGAWNDAERELSTCVARRGEAAVFLTPSLALLPDVDVALARAKEAARAR